MKRRTTVQKSRLGISWLELQAACAVFGILLSGLAPFTVMYLKQVATFEKRLNDSTVYYLIPSTDPWARKLGAAATITSTAPETPPAFVPMPIGSNQILSFDEPFSGDQLSATVSTGS